MAILGDGYGSIGSCGLVSVNSTQTAVAATYDEPSRGVIIGTAGNLCCKPVWNTDSVTIPLPAGWHPLRITQIYSTGSTAQAVSLAW